MEMLTNTTAGTKTLFRQKPLLLSAFTRKHQREDETLRSHYRLQANSLLVSNYANKRKKIIFGCKNVVFHNELARRNGKSSSDALIPFILKKAVKSGGE